MNGYTQVVKVVAEGEAYQRVVAIADAFVTVDGTTIVQAADPRTLSVGVIGPGNLPATLDLTGKTVSVAPPTANADAATKLYVDTAVAGGGGGGGTTTWLPPVIDIQSTPPGSPTAGDRYVVGCGTVGGSGTGAWVYHDGAIAVWSGSAWTFTAAVRGLAVFSLGTGNGGNMGAFIADGTYWYILMWAITQDKYPQLGGTLNLNGNEMVRNDQGSPAGRIPCYWGEHGSGYTCPAPNGGDTYYNTDSSTLMTYVVSTNGWIAG